ncbi:MAG: hypothetical protein KDK55_03410 [Chlamydiia bacterium]|nr:hypothetical protein [Chlamydiia bacterium]
MESTPPSKPEETHPVTPHPSEGKSGGNILAAMETPVRTLGQLKTVLIENLGKKEGEKFYQTFLKSFVMTMLAPIRTAEQQAQQAAKKMRQQNG